MHALFPKLFLETTSKNLEWEWTWVGIDIGWDRYIEYVRWVLMTLELQLFKIDDIIKNLQLFRQLFKVLSYYKLVV